MHLLLIIRDYPGSFSASISCPVTSWHFLLTPTLLTLSRSPWGVERPFVVLPSLTPLITSRNCVQPGARSCCRSGSLCPLSPHYVSVPHYGAQGVQCCRVTSAITRQFAKMLGAPGNVSARRYAQMRLARSRDLGWSQSNAGPFGPLELLST